MESPPVLSPSSSSRRRSSASNSPEFQFWMARNPSFPATNLHCADELFSDGVLLPLHLLHHHYSDDPPDPHLEPSDVVTTNSKPAPLPVSGPASGADLLPPPASLTITLTASKRWKDIFKKNSHGNKNDGDKDKEKKKDKKSGGGGGSGTSTAELNIYLWPFSRSRSAGTGGSRPRMAATRKVSSAPCSRSNSAGESKSKKWPSSPSRGGVHLGRSSPVWQVRRGEPVVKSAEKGVKREKNYTRRSKTVVDAGTGGGGTKAKVLNLNVPMCIGYRHHLSCRSDENSAVGIASGNLGVASRSGGGASGDGGRNSNLFNLRSLFTKKVY